MRGSAEDWMTPSTVASDICPDPHPTRKELRPAPGSDPAVFVPEDTFLDADSWSLTARLVSKIANV